MKNAVFFCFFLFLLLSAGGCFSGGTASVPAEVKVTAADKIRDGLGVIDLVDGLTRCNFTVNGKKCWVIVPENPRQNAIWCWYMAQEKAINAMTAQKMLLENGVYCAFIDSDNEADMLIFYEKLVSLGLNPKVSLAGIAAGAETAYRFAGKNPEKVKLLYGDSPSCREADAVTLKTMSDAGIAILHIAGTADTIFPMSENSDRVEIAYRNLGGVFEIIRKHGRGHRPFGLPYPEATVRFFLQYNK